MRQSPPAAPGVLFSERLWPSTGGWLLAPGLGVAIGIILVPVGTTSALVGAVVAAAVAVAALVASSPLVEVAGGCLRVGRARIPVDLLGTPTAARGEEARQERGPRLDARAYVCIRGWIDPVVRVEVTDPQDPTPYWLVSTRRPDQLVAALGGGA